MVLSISQATFDAAVKENMEEFQMTPEEAVKEAVEQFTAQVIDIYQKTTKKNFKC